MRGSITNIFIHSVLPLIYRNGVVPNNKWTTFTCTRCEFHGAVRKVQWALPEIANFPALMSSEHLRPRRAAVEVYASIVPDKGHLMGPSGPTISAGSLVRVLLLAVPLHLAGG